MMRKADLIQHLQLRRFGQATRTLTNQRQEYPRLEDQLHLNKTK